jgi:hypothetical protein
VGPCHHGIRGPQVEDGQDSLLVWRVTTNILNKWSLMAKRGGPEAMWLGKGLTSSCLQQHVLKCYAGPKREETPGYWRKLHNEGCQGQI